MKAQPKNLGEAIAALGKLEADLEALTERMVKGLTAIDDRLERVEKDRVPYALDPDLDIPPFPRVLKTQGYVAPEDREEGQGRGGLGRRKARQRARNKRANDKARAKKRAAAEE